MAGQGTVLRVALAGPQPVEAFNLTSPGARLRGTVVPSDGGGLSSLTLDGWGELLYRANQLEPPPAGEWSGRAPLLWPAVGRNFTPQALLAETPACCFEHDRVVYDLPIHGFARHRAWRPVAHRGDLRHAAVTLELADDDDTRAVYPWRFCLRMPHALSDTAYECTVEVESSEALWFCIGNHLTLALPADRFDRVTCACNTTQRLEINRHSLCSGETTPLDFSAGLPLATGGWLLNGVFGAPDGEPWMRVSVPDGPAVTVRQRVDEGAEHVAPGDWLFVVYGNREKSYYCPEPWIGRPNGLQDGRGVVKLPAGAGFSWTMRVEV
ncbi:MAG: hypothetical protein HYU66_06205 [Armatimonadetes bacterium]|nr:hypothetical protein [Armatimonadota bacterium]